MLDEALCLVQREEFGNADAHKLCEIGILELLFNICAEFCHVIHDLHRVLRAALTHHSGHTAYHPTH